jgi:hypothetical protein
MENGADPEGSQGKRGQGKEKGTDLFLLRCAENFHRMDLLGSTDSGLENKSVPSLVTTF